MGQKQLFLEVNHRNNISHDPLGLFQIFLQITWVCEYTKKTFLEFSATAVMTYPIMHQHTSAFQQAFQKWMQKNFVFCLLFIVLKAISKY